MPPEQGPDQTLCLIPVCCNNLNLQFSGHQDAVRGALNDIRDWLVSCGCSTEACGDAELVLAELLNNVAEHAYAEMPPGPVDLNLRRCSTRLCLRLRDQGHELPQGVLPQPGQRKPSPCPDDLAEGGYGWFLISELSEDLSYQREGSNNWLRLSLRIGTDEDMPDQKQG